MKSAFDLEDHRIRSTADERPTRRLRARPRDIAAIGGAVRRAADEAAAALGIRHAPIPERHLFSARGEPPGMTLRELEERRWLVAAETARAKLEDAGLPVLGRRAGLVYTWRSIFIAEGVAADTAAIATPDTHPALFDDLLDGEAAAARIGAGSPSTVRKLAGSGEIPRDAWVGFGSRGVRRFRPALLDAIRLRRLRGSLV